MDAILAKMGWANHKSGGLSDGKGDHNFMEVVTVSIFNTTVNALFDIRE